MKFNCIICGSFINIQPNRNCCINCGSNYDSQMKFIPSRHNWNLEDYSKSLEKENKLSYSKHQS